MTFSKQKGTTTVEFAIIGTVLMLVLLLTNVIISAMRGTRVDVALDLGEDRIRSIELEFVMPREFPTSERAKLERAAGSCPIKHSFHPDVRIATRFTYPMHAEVS